MLLFVFMFLVGFVVMMTINYANGRIAYNQTYCIEKAKQHANLKTWDELWKESGLTDEDARQLLEELRKIEINKSTKQ